MVQIILKLLKNDEEVFYAPWISEYFMIDETIGKFFCIVFVILSTNLKVRKYHITLFFSLQFGVEAARESSYLGRGTISAIITKPLF